MAATLFDADELLRRPPAGSLRPLVVAGVLSSCLLTVLVTAVGGDALLGQVQWSGAHPILDKVLGGIAPFAMFVILAGALFFPSRVHGLSRAARTAVMLPFAHLALIVGAALISTQIDSGLQQRDLPMLQTLPIVPTFFALALLVALAARFIPRRREQMHGLILISLAFLFALGLWLPIASHLWRAWGLDPYYRTFSFDESALPTNWGLALRVVAVPFVVACFFALLELRFTDRIRRWRPVIAIVAVGILIGGASARYNAAHAGGVWDDMHADAALNVYANFIHVLLIAVALAFVALAAFVVAQRRAEKPRAGMLSRRGFVRVSNPDTETAWRTPVGTVEITSWLRPPRTSIGAFTLVTEHGDIPISAGGTLGGALPLTTTILFNGEAVVVLRDGDDVEVSGLVEERAGASPFRSAAILVPGPEGVVVRAPRLETRGASVLALWRPSLAYMAIAAAVAISALSGISGSRT
ncbi:MAG TPA: hypothetical protein VGM90_25030 [Kofleriaceae bacterium]